MKGRVWIEHVTPSIDGGRYAAKAVVGDDVVVGADVFRDGHDKVAAVVRYRGPGARDWSERPLRLDVDDRWYGAFPVDRIGAWRYQILAWSDHYASWLDAITKKHRAGRTGLEVDTLVGVELLERREVAKTDRQVTAPRSAQQPAPSHAY